MCSKPPKPPKPATPPPVEAPEIDLGAEDKAEDQRLRKRRGRNQLRTGLTISGGTGQGLSV